VWLIGVVVRLLAAPWVQLSISAGSGWPHNALQHHWLMPISCHFQDCKALLVTSLTRVSGAIASVQTFTFTFMYSDTQFAYSRNLLIAHNTVTLIMATVDELRPQGSIAANFSRKLGLLNNQFSSKLTYMPYATIPLPFSLSLFHTHPPSILFHLHS